MLLLLRLSASDATQCISVWYGNSSNQDCKALQRVVWLAERISRSALPSLQDIYLKRCKSRAAKIIKDSNHPGNRLFILLPSGKHFRSIWDPGSSVRMPQNALYHPPLLPIAAPPQVCRFCHWSRLHSVWRRGSRCPACLAGSRTQFDSAT